jgi:predicted nucleotidyltransferase
MIFCKRLRDYHFLTNQKIDYLCFMNLSVADKLILQQYFAGIPVKRAYLFGSMARNEAREESDIDILVELDHSNPIGMKFFAYQSDLEELLHKKVDLVTTEGLSKYVKPFIDKDKILIYERVNH